MTIDDHMREIIGCPIVQQCLQGNSQHPCSALVNNQSKDRPFHVPTPWVGNLPTATVLILSSNPSIDIGELYPAGQLYQDGKFVGNEKWTSEAEVFDYFNNLFDGNTKKWVSDRRVLRKNGIDYGVKNRYWGAVLQLANEIMPHPSKLGTDIAITEVVRCKSRKEQHGVQEAAPICSDRYLEKTLQLSGARVIICAGKFAVDYFRNRYRQYLPNIPLNAYIDGFISGAHVIEPIGLLERYIAFLPHPTGARGLRTFGGLFRDNMKRKQLEDLREFLRKNVFETKL